MDKGIIFATDAVIAFIVVLITLMVFSIMLGSESQSLASSSKDYFLEQKTLAVADALVKNSYKEGEIGLCIFDAEKKRVLSNEINSVNIYKLAKIEQDNFFLKSISFSSPKRKEKRIFEKKEGECIVAKRFVLIDGEKGMLFVEGCTFREGEK